MRKIILVRHGHRHEDESVNADLSPLGQEQALVAAYDVLGKIDKNIRVFSSPYKRCWRTAKIICDKLNVHVNVDHALREHPSEVPFKDDDRDKLVNDLKRFLEENNEDIVVVSHLRTIKEIIGIVTGEYPTDMKVPACSVNVISQKH